MRLRRSKKPKESNPVEDVLKSAASKRASDLPSIKGKTKARKCFDEQGNAYASLLEFDTCQYFFYLQEIGTIKDFRMQIPFNFQKVNINTEYIADLSFHCLKDFYFDGITKGKVAKKKRIDFTAGKIYVCDVKCPYTAKDAVYLLKKKLMKGVFGIDIIELVNKPPRLTELILKYGSKILFENPRTP